MLPDEKDGEKIHYTGKISAEKVGIYSKYTPTKIVMKQWVKAIRKYVNIIGR